MASATKKTLSALALVLALGGIVIVLVRVRPPARPCPLSIRRRPANVGVFFSVSDATSRFDSIRFVSFRLVSFVRGTSAPAPAPNAPSRRPVRVYRVRVVERACVNVNVNVVNRCRYSRYVLFRFVSFSLRYVTLRYVTLIMDNGGGTRYAVARFDLALPCALRGWLVFVLFYNKTAKRN